MKNKANNTEKEKVKRDTTLPLVEFGMRIFAEEPTEDQKIKAKAEITIEGDANVAREFLMSMAAQMGLNPGPFNMGFRNRKRDNMIFADQDLE